MKNRKCPNRSHCWDYKSGNCENCGLGDHITKLHKKIDRLKANNEELIYKLECLLCHATGGKLSKHTYTLQVMESAVNDYIQDCCNEYVEEVESEVIDDFVKRLLDAFPESNRDARCPAIYYDDYRYFIEELAEKMKGGAE